MPVPIIICQVQELRGNIRVFCRCRYDDRGSCALKFENGEIVVCRTPQGRKKTFEFERVYTPDTTQEKVKYKIYTLPLGLSDTESIANYFSIF